MNYHLAGILLLLAAIGVFLWVSNKWMHLYISLIKVGKL